LWSLMVGGGGGGGRVGVGILLASGIITRKEGRGMTNGVNPYGVKHSSFMERTHQFLKKGKKKCGGRKTRIKRISSRRHRQKPNSGEIIYGQVHRGIVLLKDRKYLLDLGRGGAGGRDLEDQETKRGEGTRLCCREMLGNLTNVGRER